MEQALKDGKHKSLEDALEQAHGIDSTDAIADEELQTMIKEAEKVMLKVGQPKTKSKGLEHPAKNVTERLRILKLYLH